MQSNNYGHRSLSRCAMLCASAADTVSRDLPFSVPFTAVMPLAQIRHNRCMKAEIDMKHTVISGFCPSRALTAAQNCHEVSCLSMAAEAKLPCSEYCPSHSVLSGLHCWAVRYILGILRQSVARYTDTSHVIRQHCSRAATLLWRDRSA